MVAVGLNAARITMSSPLEIPPWMPPERLVRVRMRADWLIEVVVVLRAAQVGAGEAAAALEPLAGRQRQHRLGQVGLQLVEHRLAQPRRHAAGHRLDHAAQRVALLPGAVDEGDHLLGQRGVRAADDVRLHVRRG